VVWLDQGGQQRDLNLIAPPPALEDAVEHFWMQGPMPADVWRVVPDHRAHVIFTVAHGRFGLAATCCVVGARSRFCDIRVAGRILTIGARLRPGALPRLIADDAAQLTDRSVELECVAGRNGRDLVERMAQVCEHEAGRLLTGFLRERFMAAKPVARRNLIYSSGSVDQLARTLAISRRGLYDRMISDIGLSPKLMLRIERLHQALLVVNRGVLLADAAAVSGYSDQAHLTREAKCLLGEPPLAWQRRAAHFFKT
jgi:AraC-like DNA-binding protein